MLDSWELGIVTIWIEREMILIDGNRKTSTAKTPTAGAVGVLSSPIKITSRSTLNN
jgi:hypothetical protein